MGNRLLKWGEGVSFRSLGQAEGRAMALPACGIWRAWMWTGSWGCWGLGAPSFQRTAFSQWRVLSSCAVSNSCPGHVPPEAPTASREASQVAFLPTPAMASPRPCSLMELRPPRRSSVGPLWRKKAPRSGSPRNCCS